MTTFNYSQKTLDLVEKIKSEGKTVRLSNTSKLGVKSWSLQAVKTCPAAIDKNGNLVAACSGCYATSGNYRFSNVQAPRLYNQIAWESQDFVEKFVEELQNERFFRWFDSGDMYSLKLAEKIFKIMQLTPHVKHWLPTRMHKFPKFASIIRQMASLENVVVRLSSDSINGEKVNSQLVDTNSTILDQSSLDNLDKSIFVCKAFEQDGKCLTCKACYDKGVKTIGYVGHGVTMKKRQKQANTARLIDCATI